MWGVPLHSGQGGLEMDVHFFACVVRKLWEGSRSEVYGLCTQALVLPVFTDSSAGSQASALSSAQGLEQLEASETETILPFHGFLVLCQKTRHPLPSGLS